MVAALIFPSLLINENAPVYMHIKKVSTSTSALLVCIDKCSVRCYLSVYEHAVYIYIYIYTEHLSLINFNNAYLLVSWGSY